MKLLCSFIFAMVLASVVVAEDNSTETAVKNRFTFSYPFADDDTMKPRGSSTKGLPLTLTRQASAAWQSLQAAGINAQERDRRAILAMAGEYRVSFDFLEVVQFDTHAPKDVPYQSWATEKVYVIENRPDFVSLQHILVQHILNQEGKVESPIVTKHWRQDWRYEPGYLDEYLGPVRWQRRKLDAEDSMGRWSQTAYQVDDSPRYAAIGRWEHNPSFSTWISGNTLRPLPRREYTFRNDYQQLIATNRHTILPTGWVQEENNLKSRVTQPAQSPTLPFAGREYGIARYERITGTDFSAGDRYWQQSSGLWSQVREYWAELFASGKPICLRAAPDQNRLYIPLFEMAADTKKLKAATESQLREWSRQIIEGYLASRECNSQTKQLSNY